MADPLSIVVRRSAISGYRSRALLEKKRDSQSAISGDRSRALLKTKRDGQSAKQWLHQIIAAKRANSKFEEIYKSSISSHHLKNSCGTCHFRYTTVSGRRNSSSQPSSTTSGIQFCYIFPPWLGLLIINIRAPNSLGGWYFNLSCRKVMSSSHLMLVESNDLELLGAAIASDQLSIKYVDYKGRSILWVSLSLLRNLVE